MIRKRRKIRPPDSVDAPILFNHPQDIAQIERAHSLNARAEAGTLEYFLAMLEVAAILFEKKSDLAVSPGMYKAFAKACRINATDCAILWRLGDPRLQELGKSWANVKIRTARESHNSVPKLSWQWFLRDIEPKADKPAPSEDKSEDNDDDDVAFDGKVLDQVKQERDEAVTLIESIRKELLQERDRVYDLETQLAAAKTEINELQKQMNPIVDPAPMKRSQKSRS